MSRKTVQRFYDGDGHKSKDPEHGTVANPKGRDGLYCNPTVLEGYQALAARSQAYSSMCSLPGWTRSRRIPNTCAVKSGFDRTTARRSDMAHRWRDNGLRYGLVTRILHWSMAVVILWQFSGLVINRL